PSFCSLPPFPTRRSSDLQPNLINSAFIVFSRTSANLLRHAVNPTWWLAARHTTSRSARAIQIQSAGLLASVFRGKKNPFPKDRRDRKSTRLNSSHDQISY